MVPRRFAQWALKELPITIFGDGSQSRCFGHVDDIVCGFMSHYDNPDAIGQAFNSVNAE
jgi:UDP-glucose 4-epimerase